jgi:hypothetical protein
MLAVQEPRPARSRCAYEHFCVDSGKHELPTQDSIDQTATRANDLTGQTQKRVHKRLELHAQDRLFLLPMTLDVTARTLRRPLREPRL